MLRCVALCHTVLHFRYHNDNVGQRCRTDFRRLAEKVAQQTVTGDEEYTHTFRRKTPTDVHGAVAQVEVSAWRCIVLRSELHSAALGVAFVG